MNKQRKQTISIPVGVHVSQRLMSLCDILNERINKTGDLKLFEPDEQTTKTYALKKAKGQYWVSGYLTTTPLFSTNNAAIPKGSTIVAITSACYTFTVPLQYLNELLHLPGITNADCAKPVNFVNSKFN